MSEQLPNNVQNQPENQADMEHTRQIEAVYGDIDFEDSNTADRGGLNEDNYAAHESALEALDNGEIPKELELPRDWSDTLAQHEEKQAAHVQGVADIITARLVNSDIAQKRAAEKEVVTAHNEKLTKRQETKDAFLQAQQLKHGENYMKLFKNEMNEAAEQHVADTLGEEYRESAVDTDDLKQETADRKEKAQESTQKTLDAANEFRRGFAEEPPKSKDAIEPTPSAADVSDDSDSAGAEPTTEIVPVVTDDSEYSTDLEVREKGWRGRLKRAWNKARYELTTMALNPKEYFTDQEKGTRRKIFAGAVGAAAVGLALYATQKSGNNMLETVPSGDSASSYNGEGWDLYSQPSGLELSPDVPASADMQPPAAMHAELAQPPMHETVSATMTLDPGENIWNKSAEYLQAHNIPATDVNIDTVKDAVLKHQGITELEAARLPVGYEFTIPQEVIDELSKSKS